MSKLAPTRLLLTQHTSYMNVQRSEHEWRKAVEMMEGHERYE